MAQQINCDGPDGGPAIFLVTNIEEADTKGFCLECFTGFALAYIEVMAPAMLAKPEPKQRRPRAPKSAAAATQDAKGGTDEHATAEDGQRAAAG